jgi:hypothetical protein
MHKRNKPSRGIAPTQPIPFRVPRDTTARSGYAGADIMTLDGRLVKKGAGYPLLHRVGLGRVQSSTLPKISVDEATDFIVHRRRMEAPAQEWAAETMIITVVVIALKVVPGINMRRNRRPH